MFIPQKLMLFGRVILHCCQNMLIITMDINIYDGYELHNLAYYINIYIYIYIYIYNFSLAF